MINEWLEQLSSLIQSSLWLAPVLALLAGILTSFTPCSLSSIPLVIGYVGGTGQKNTKRAFRLSLTFALGSAVTFTILGVIASLAGKLMGTSAGWWYIILGVLMVLMALQTWGVFEIIPSSYLISKKHKKRLCGCVYRRNTWGCFLIALFNACSDCTACYRSRKRQHCLGDSLTIDLLCRSWYPCNSCRYIGRISAKDNN